MLTFLLLAAGVTCKWLLHPGTIAHQQTVGAWLLAAGIVLVVVQLALFLFVAAFGRD